MNPLFRTQDALSLQRRHLRDPDATRGRAEYFYTREDGSVLLHVFVTQDEEGDWSVTRLRTC